MKRGRLNFIGKLQLQGEKFREIECENIYKLRSLRTQEAIMKVLKTRKTIHLGQLYLEVIDILRSMFLPSQELIKEQVDWLKNNEYIKGDANDSTVLVYQWITKLHYCVITALWMTFVIETYYCSFVLLSSTVPVHSR